MRNVLHIRSRGFTLIEVLASMAILSLLVLLVGRLFTDASKAYETGTRRAENNSLGRAVIDLVTRDMSHAVVDDLLTFKLDSSAKPTFSFDSDKVYFVALSNNESDTRRAAQELGYYVSNMTDVDNPGYRYRLMRSAKRDASKIQCYNQTDWYNSRPSAPVQVADNIRTFEVFVYDENGVVRSDYDSQAHGPPLYADIYLEMLGEGDAIRAAAMANGGAAPADVAAFCDRRAKRFQSRVFFHNRDGYTR